MSTKSKNEEFDNSRLAVINELNELLETTKTCPEIFKNLEAQKQVKADLIKIIETISKL